MGDKQKFAFDKTNFILLAIGMAVVNSGLYPDDRAFIVGNGVSGGHFQCEKN